jgi:hypothetical protein
MANFPPDGPSDLNPEQLHAAQRLYSGARPHAAARLDPRPSEHVEVNAIHLSHFFVQGSVRAANSMRPKMHEFDSGLVALRLKNIPGLDTLRLFLLDLL